MSARAKAQRPMDGATVMRNLDIQVLSPLPRARLGILMVDPQTPITYKALSSPAAASIAFISFHNPPSRETGTPSGKADSYILAESSSPAGVPVARATVSLNPVHRGKVVVDLTRLVRRLGEPLHQILCNGERAAVV